MKTMMLLLVGGLFTVLSGMSLNAGFLPSIVGDRIQLTPSDLNLSDTVFTAKPKIWGEYQKGGRTFKTKFKVLDKVNKNNPAVELTAESMSRVRLYEPKVVNSNYKKGIPVSWGDNASYSLEVFAQMTKKDRPVSLGWKSLDVGVGDDVDSVMQCNVDVDNRINPDSSKNTMAIDAINSKNGITLTMYSLGAKVLSNGKIKAKVKAWLEYPLQYTVTSTESEYRLTPVKITRLPVVIDKKNIRQSQALSDAYTLDITAPKLAKYNWDFDGDGHEEGLYTQLVIDNGIALMTFKIFIMPEDK